MQPAQLADPEPPVPQPGHDQPVPGRADRLPSSSPGRRRRASSDAGAATAARGQRVGRQLAAHVPQERPLPVRPGRQPGPVQLRAQLRVDAQRAPGAGRTPSGTRPPPTARSAERAACQPATARHTARARRADGRHVPLQVPQRHRSPAPGFPLQPAQVIHQQVRIRPLRPRSVVAPAGTGRPASCTSPSGHTIVNDRAASCRSTAWTRRSPMTSPCPMSPPGFPDVTYTLDTGG